MPLNWDALIPLLRSQLAHDYFRITDHAEQRCGSRNISVEDIKNCIMTGIIIEEQNWGPDPKLLIRGNKEDGIPIHVIVALTDDQPWVVTVCNIDEDIWEVVNGLIRRR